MRSALSRHTPLGRIRVCLHAQYRALHFYARSYFSPITHSRTVMTLILIIIIGGLIGWIASKIMGTDPQQGIFLNIVVGIVGALLAGFIINPLIGGGNIVSGDFSISALLVSLVGAVILIWIVGFIRKKT